MIAVRMEQDRDSRTQTSLPQLESERCSTGGVSGIEHHHGLDPQYDVLLNLLQFGNLLPMPVMTEPGAQTNGDLLHAGCPSESPSRRSESRL